MKITLFFGPLLAVSSLFSAVAQAQLSTRPEIEVRQSPQRLFALTHARIVLGAKDVRENATLVLENGRISAILDSDQAIPAGAAVIDVKGKTIRPAFVDLASTVATDTTAACASNSNIGFVAPKDPAAAFGPSTAVVASQAGHWNKLVCPERRVALSLKFDEAKLLALRKLGFGYVLSHENDGVLRGSSALVSLRKGASAAQNLIAADVTQDIAIEQIFDFSGAYPTSYMGAIALLRQAFIDARWQQNRLNAIVAGKNLERPEANRALDALAPVLNNQQKLMMFARDELDFARAQRVADEQNLPLITVGNGFEYRVLNALVAAKTPIVLPLNFPAAPSVDDPEKALDVSLAELEHWRYSPFNAGLLASRNVQFSLSSFGLDKPEDFASNLRKAIDYGLSEASALDALTEVPAKMLGMRQIGQLTPGSAASFSIADESLLRSADAKLYEMWIDGEREIFAEIGAVILKGKWRFTAGHNTTQTLSIEGDSATLVEANTAQSMASSETKANASDKSADEKANGAASKDVSSAGSGPKIAVTSDNSRVLVHFPANATKALQGAPGNVAISVDFAMLGEQLSGRWFDANGVAHQVILQRIADAETTPEKDKKVAEVPALPSDWRYPAGEYGRLGLPAQNSVLIKNVTAWVTGKAQAESNVDVLIQDGRIRAIGKALKAPENAQTVDGTGKHLSPGLIDAHSHIAANGNVNEGSHAVTSEVRVGDIIDPTDINIYRELAGGTTTSQVLHGSANAIGGQAQVIKHRWGASAEQLKFAGVVPTIKFALGENPKQSNWGDNFRTRYPQTRMGVEALIRAQFVQAKAYGAALKADPSTRRDLRLEPLWEILQGKRLVHIHSYRADEILMFVRLSHEFGFKIGAFQHVLEGYKVAKEINEVAAGASTFSDWWAFKMEVQDAIPNNAALMQRQGVLVSLNSDSPDLGRRLNTEAAKTLRYGNLSEIEALQMVTLNPAKQLRIDGEVGSIEVGKSADLVLWNHPPLSTMARPERVWIDGRLYFEREADQAEQARVNAVRAELVQAALTERVKSLAPKADAEPQKLALIGYWASKKHWPSLWMAKRGLYHNGEATHFCTDGE